MNITANPTPPVVIIDGKYYVVYGGIYYPAFPDGTIIY